MKCLDCGGGHQGGVYVEEYSGIDVDNEEILQKLKLYLFETEPRLIGLKEKKLRYCGYDLNTAIRYKNGEIDTTKETLHMITVDEILFNKLKEIWKKETENQ